MLFLLPHLRLVQRTYLEADSIPAPCPVLLKLHMNPKRKKKKVFYRAPYPIGMNTNILHSFSCNRCDISWRSLMSPGRPKLHIFSTYQSCLYIRDKQPSALI